MTGLLLFKIMEDWCFLCWSGVISKERSLSKCFKSVKTGIVDLVQAPVSPDNFKTCDCFTKFCNLASSFASFSLPPLFLNRVPLSYGSCHSGFICIHKIWKLNHWVWNEVLVLHSILHLIHTVYMVCENRQYTVIFNNLFWHQYHRTTQTRNCNVKLWTPKTV
jgi:hypothetical protein